MNQAIEWNGICFFGFVAHLPAKKLVLGILLVPILVL